jgi:hypothetical protein
MSYFIVEPYLHINAIDNSLSIRQITRSRSILSKRIIVVVFVTALLPCELGHLIFISSNLWYYDELSLCLLIRRGLMRQNVFCRKSSSNSLREKGRRWSVRSADYRRPFDIRKLLDDFPQNTFCRINSRPIRTQREIHHSIINAKI